jgi:predicted transcriptional regulator
MVGCIAYVLFAQNVKNVQEGAGIMRAQNALAQVERTTALTAAQRRFADDLGQLYARYGIAVTFGRVFALLLLNDEPISLDDIATQLEVSKSAVSVATRDLERVGIARRVGQPGSRRVLYEANDDMAPIFDAMFARIRQSVPVFQQADPLLRPGKARVRLREMLELHEFWLTEGADILERWRRRRRAAR